MDSWEYCYLVLELFQLSDLLDRVGRCHFLLVCGLFIAGSFSVGYQFYIYLLLVCYLVKESRFVLLLIECFLLSSVSPTLLCSFISDCFSVAFGHFVLKRSSLC